MVYRLIMLPHTPSSLGDQKVRVDLRDHFIAMRKLANMSQRDVAIRLGRHKSAVSLIESRTDWRCRTAQRLFRAIDCRLSYEVHELPELDPDDAFVAVLTAKPPRSPAAEDIRNCALAHYRIVHARLILGRTQGWVAEQAGMNEKAFSEWERTANQDSLVSSLQRGARALGGYLGFQVTKLAVANDDLGRAA